MSDDDIAFSLTVPIEEGSSGPNGRKKGQGEVLRECSYTLIVTAEGEDAEVILEAFGRKP